MPYRIKRTESVQSAIRRIAQEQISKGVAEIDDGSLDRHETVHQVRKRCKKIRGLIRLARPAFEATYQRENEAFRDAARKLSKIRDAKSIIETYDRLLERFEAEVKRSAFGSLRQRLTLRLNGIKASNIDQQLAGVRKAFSKASERAEEWKLSESGFDAVCGGLAKTRQRAVDRLADVRQQPSTELLHQWRKRTKYHGYQLRLLRKVWPDVVGELRDALDQLGELLGEDHDLAVFVHTLSNSGLLSNGDSDLSVLVALSEQRRQELQSEAIRLGRYVYAEPTENLTERFRSYWRLWRRQR